MFVLSSVPLHVLFNSAVFATEYATGNWWLTIASESFLQNGTYWGPGALVPPGVTKAEWGYGSTGIDFSDTSYLTLHHGTQSDYNQNLARAAEEAVNWDRLSAKDCFSQYTKCGTRDEFQDVVVVVESSEGWMPSKLYDMEATLGDTFWNIDEDIRSINTSLSRNSNYGSLWDIFMPPERVNDLWFFALCYDIWSFPNTRYEDNNGGSCSNQCAGALNGFMESTAGKWQLNGFNTTYLTKSGIGDHLPRPHLLDEPSDLTVLYCMAKRPTYQCKVGLSTAILLIVVACTFVKVSVCAVVLALPTQAYLVTPGDAIASYIVEPDSSLTSTGVLNPRSLPLLRDGSSPRLPLGAFRWTSQGPRLGSRISVWVWVGTYTLFAATLATVAALMSLALSSEPLSSFG